MTSVILANACPTRQATEAAVCDYGCMPRTAAQPSSPAPGAVRGGLPSGQAPQLCQLVTEAPDSADWLSGIKFDGYRLIASINEGRVRLLTRRGLDWTDRLPHVAAAFARLDVSTAMLDGELVRTACSASGIPLRGRRPSAAVLRVRPAAPQRLGLAALCAGP